MVNDHNDTSRPRSAAVFAQAKNYFVAGVNSPVRAFTAVGGTPVVAARGAGAFVTDVDGLRYIDYVLSWGPLILGHAHPEVVAAVHTAVAAGTSFGMPTEAENRLAAAIRRFFPEMELLRLVNSGTEAVMSALRLARGFTGRDKVVKFVGCYHGHVDALLVQAGSGLATFGTPSSPGVPAAVARSTLALPFNDTEALRAAFAQHGPDIAAVILETLPCNMGLIPPDPQFLATLQTLAAANGSLVIADEVLTGLRVGPGGAYHRFGLKPDLVAVGKVVGGGFPLAAYGGRRELMMQLSPLGPVYQAGTLSGNPVAATAGAVTLEILARDEPFAALADAAAIIAATVREQANAHGIDVYAESVGSIFGIAFRRGVPHDLAAMQAADHERYRRLFWGLLERGIYLAPSGYEVGFLSTAHDQTIIEQTIAAIKDVFAAGILV